ncbi:MAG: DUF4238 domain-containing protein [Promethearchaeota archaeon]
MGKHYIPKFYLKGFATSDNENKIITYQCKPEKQYKTNIINIAQENNFYSDKKEKYLSEDIEGPANDILRKIRNKEKLSADEKYTFTNYLVVFLKRVPSFVDQVKSKFPDVAKSTIEKVKSHYKDLIIQGEIDETSWEKFNYEIEKIGKLYFNDGDKVREIWLDYLSPETSPRIQYEIFKKKWVFLTTKNNYYYLTCDNPFFFFTGSGLRNSQISFPISKETALLALNSNIKYPNYAIPRTQIVKEINRRSISNAKNYVYSPKDEDWILKIIRKKGNIFLRQINLSQ